jgi:hypothetical protein
MIKQRIISLAIAFLLVVCFVPVVKSLSIQTFSTDSTTGWTVSGWDHIGSKNITYTYGPLFSDYGYNENLSSALALWGSSYITMSLSTTSPNLITLDTTTPPGSSVGDPSYAYVQVFSVNGSNHITKWRMTILHNNIKSLGTTGINKVLAHEIGHIAGLDHVENASSIMNRYYSSSMGVRTQDRRGMEVCTHQHTHSGSYSKTYEPYSANGHKTRCTYCKAYSLDVHVFVNKRCKFCGLGQGISPYSFEQYKLNYLRNAASDR